MSVCRYRETITEELSRACNLAAPTVWRQAKDMLKEEGIDIAADADNGAQAAAAETPEAAVQVCFLFTSESVCVSRPLSHQTSLRCQCDAKL